jgi:hypothetical protein
MDNLLTLARREFPGFEPTHLFEAAIPIFFLRVLVEALEPQTLSSFETYFLHAVSANVHSLAEIAWLYGIDEADLLAPGASLLKREYIWQGAPAGGERPVHLTEKGRLALGADTAPPAPARRGAHMHFNALTWTPVPQEKQLLMSVERMNAEGLCILPPLRYELPTLGDLTIDKVTAALHDLSFFHDKQIIALLEMQRCRPEYLAPVQVVCLRQHREGQQRLAIYRRGIYQRSDSAVLQRFLETGKFLVPDDAVALTPPPLQVPATLPQAVAQAADTLVSNETAMRGLQAELSDTASRRAATQSGAERRQLEQRIGELEAALQQKREESDQLRARLEQQQGSFLRTEQHRGALEQALTEVGEELIIIAPWLNRRTCDDALCTLVAQAVKRGVAVRIGYGVTERAGDPDVARNRANAQRVIRAMNDAVEREGSAAPGGRLEIVRVSDTHQKILVCDRAYGILGSFNWLSYRGELDEQYRNETSVVLREPAAVEELTRIALRTWPQQP